MTKQVTAIDPQSLIQFAAAAYQDLGMPFDDALLAADSLVQADLCGHQSHGLLRLAWYCARLRSGAMRAVTKTEVMVDAGAICVLEGHDGVGQVIAGANRGLLQIGTKENPVDFTERNTKTHACT